MTSSHSLYSSHVSSHLLDRQKRKSQLLLFYQVAIFFLVYPCLVPALFLLFPLFIFDLCFHISFSIPLLLLFHHPHLFCLHSVSLPISFFFLFISFSMILLVSYISSSPAFKFFLYDLYLSPPSLCPLSYSQSSTSYFSPSHRSLFFLLLSLNINFPLFCLQLLLVHLHFCLLSFPLIPRLVLHSYCFPSFVFLLPSLLVFSLDSFQTTTLFFFNLFSSSFPPLRKINIPFPAFCPLLLSLSFHLFHSSFLVLFSFFFHLFLSHFHPSRLYFHSFSVALQFVFTLVLTSSFSLFSFILLYNLSALFRNHNIRYSNISFS